MPLRTGRCATWCLAVWAATCGASRADTPADDGKGAAARAILDAWHAASPEPGDRKLHVVAWRAKDRDFAPDHRVRLDRILIHIQDFYRRELERHGLGPRSIRLDRDADGRLVVHEITGEAPWADYDGDDGQRIRGECVPLLRERGIDADGETLMIFTNLAEWDPEKLAFRHKSPYYAGGNHRRGTAWQLDSAELDIANLAAQQPTVSDGQYGRISLGRHVSIFIGGIAHEMGHALGLPHCRERDDEAVRGTALMGSGNRTYGDELRSEGKGTFLTLAHALRLASHPQFSGSVKGLTQKAQATLTGVDVAAPDGRSFTVRGVVTGEPPVYAVVAYLDPAGSGDYDARTVTAVPDAAGRFTLDCTPLVADKVAELRLVACHANGATTRIMTQGYAVAPDGTVDVAALAATTGLTEFLDALDRGGVDAARAIHAGLPRDSRTSRIAAAILTGRDPHRVTRSPAETAADVHELPLSHATPAEARVGWLRPAYDHLPRRDALLTAVGRVYDAGIYAHAPALHRYDLARSWDRLRGSCSLADGTTGSVVCLVRVDGVETFRSRRLAAGDLQDFDVAVDGARTLELVVEDAGDGNHSDWAVWLAPRLTRGDAAAAR